jgi:hypothetical protein
MPNAHQRLISCDDFRFIILATRGMFQNGRMIPAINDILANKLIMPIP